VNKKEGILEQK